MARLVVSFLLVSLAAFAQTTSTEVLGTVSDASGAVIPGAKVTLHRAATGQSRETTTTPEGNYSFPLIDIGEYTVTVAAQGFKTREAKGIGVQLQQKARVDFQMEVGATTETVEVSAAVVSLKTEDSTVGQVIDNKRVVELPLNGRNVATLAVLIPGVQFGIRQGFDGSGGFPIPGNGVAIVANGQRDVNQQVTLDGIIATEPRVNTATFSPSIDALEEFKVLTSSYSAEYGQNSGAVVQMVVKSGTNQLKGTVFEFLRNNKLAAKDYFLNFQQPAGSRQTPKDVIRRNQFGAFVSGPVMIPKLYNGKDRTFWSFNYEGRRETKEFVREDFWFPQAFRDGDFSALLTPFVRDGRAVRSPIIIHDPTTGEPFRDSTGRITNIIPASRINKNAQAFINKFQPLPQFKPDDILDINTRGLVPNIIKNNQYMFRIDHNFSSSDKVFFRYITDRGFWDQRDLNPNFPYFVDSKNWNLGTQWVKIISPRVLNEFRYGINKSDNNTLNPRSNTDFDLDTLGIGNFRKTSGEKFTKREVGIPSTVIGGDRDGGNGYDFNTTHQISDNFVFTRGNHNFKTGMEYRRNILDRAAANVARGSVSCCPGGYSLAGWLMGFVGSTETGEGFPFTAPRQNRWSAYFLDDWKVTRKLTINAGLRWDLFQVPLDSFGAWRTLRLDILTPDSLGRNLPTVIPPPGTKNFAIYDSDNRYFMPRVGIAYRATEKWVVRAGGGWFANANQLNNFTILNLVPPASGTLPFPYVDQVAQTIPYAYNGQNFTIQTRRVVPGTPQNTLTNLYGGGSGASRLRNTILVPPDSKSSNHVQWSLDIQRQLPFNLSLTVGYVGSKTSHLDQSISFNNPQPKFQDTNVQARRPYPFHVSQGEGNQAFGTGNIRYLDSYANGSYHGLQNSLEKRFSKGLVFGVAYTYSKALGEGYERNNSQDSPQDPNDRRSSRRRYPFDVAHNGVINFVYEMPFLQRFKGVTGAFIGGWQINGILILRTGFPFGVQGTGNLNTGGVVLPDRVADGRLGDKATRQLWFDPTAFRRTDCNIPNKPELCHYGNAGFNMLNSPGAKNIDFSTYKNWKLPFISDRGSLQFRAEFFNLFNTPQFGQPNGIGFATLDSVIPDATRMGEIRSLRLPMRVIQLGAKIYF